MSGQAVWQTVSNLLIKFYQVCQRLPKQLLLMRDGLIQDDEFEITIAALEEQGIRVDVIGVRKSGGGRMGISYDGTQYRNAPEGTIVLLPEENSFLLACIIHEDFNIEQILPTKKLERLNSTLFPETNYKNLQKKLEIAMKIVK